MVPSVKVMLVVTTVVMVIMVVNGGSIGDGSGG